MQPITEEDIKRIYQDSAPVSNSSFKLAFSNVVRLIKLAEQDLLKRIDAKLADVERQIAGYSARIDAHLAQLKDGQDGKDGKDADEQAVVQAVLKNIRQPKDGETPIIDYDRIVREAVALIPAPKDGEDADAKAITQQVLVELDRRVPLLGDALRAGLENHVKGMVAKLDYGPGGGTSFSIQRLGVQKVQQPLSLNFKGAGAPTITVGQNGVTNLDFPSGGGGGFTPLAATETPNSILKVFTFSAASAQPSYLVVDNVWMKPTTAAGTVNWTWAGTQATLTVPPSDDLWAVV